MDAIMLHKGEDLPTFYYRLYDQDNGQWVDLSAPTAVVTAKFRKRGTTTVLQTIVCAKFAGGSTGYVTMTWPATALDVTAGRYEIEVAVSFAGSIQTANRYYMTGVPDDDADTLPIKVKADF